MLTKRHLAILRAALKYFHEEMYPHGQDVVRHYFDGPLVEALKAEEIQELRELLRSSKVRYACCDPTGTRLIAYELSAKIEDACSMTTEQSFRVATVMVPTTG